MFLDVDDAVLAVAKSFGRVLSTKTLDERVSAATDLLRKLDHVDALQNDVVRLHRVRASERRTSQSAHNHCLTSAYVTFMNIYTKYTVNCD